MYSYQGQEEVQKPWVGEYLVHLRGSKVAIVTEWAKKSVWSFDQYGNQERDHGRHCLKGECLCKCLWHSFMLLISHQTLHLAIQRPLHLNFWKDWMVNKVIIQIPESKDGVQRSSLVGLSHWDAFTGNQREPGYRKYTQLT